MKISTLGSPFQLCPIPHRRGSRHLFGLPLMLLPILPRHKQYQAEHSHAYVSVHTDFVPRC